MKRDVYYRGVPGKKYGIWNDVTKQFQFGICEDTPMLAEARLFQKIGDNARKYRFNRGCFRVRRRIVMADKSLILFIGLFVGFLIGFLVCAVLTANKLK